MAAPTGLSRTVPPPSPYRPDIDGLRAVAVLSVILFHFDVAPFSGGFVGVDIFFVISGYLITGIVEAEGAAGRVSILGFYERRLRRIAPALLLVIAVSTLTSLFILLPGDLRPVGRSLREAAVYASNIYFYTTANDYFAADNLTLTPVLHTWSLAVEAQFYLVYPWLLVWLGRRRGLGRPVLAGLALASFAGAAWWAVHAQSTAFYLLEWRAWELLLGGLLALSPARPTRRMRGAQAMIGLGLVAVAIFGFTRETPFPGAAALLPCLGAALIIRAGSDVSARTATTRVLSFPPVVLVGRISYSLYLWHWPLLVFASYGHGDPLSVRDRAALVGLAFLLAAASWRFVERPFITRRVLRGRRALFTCQDSSPFRHSFYS